METETVETPRSIAIRLTASDFPISSAYRLNSSSIVLDACVVHKPPAIDCSDLTPQIQNRPVSISSNPKQHGIPCPMEQWKRSTAHNHLKIPTMKNLIYRQTCSAASKDPPSVDMHSKSGLFKKFIFALIFFCFGALAGIMITIEYFELLYNIFK